MARYLLAFTFVFSCFIASGQIKTDTASAAPADTLKAPAVNFLKRQPYQIIIPKGWKIKEDCQDKNCSLLSPSDTLNVVDRFVENINIVFDKLPSPSYTVEKYAEYSRTYLPQVVKGFKVLERKKLKPNVYMMVYSGEKNNFAQTWRQYYHVKNQKVYVVTFAAETHKYEYYVPLVTESLASFKIF